MMFRLLPIVALMIAGAWYLLGAPSEDSDAATIINSGSTNRPGFRIVVDRSGVAELTPTRRRFGARQAQPTLIRRMLPNSLVEAFYSDLKTAKPLDSLPAVHCAKSASFGSTFTVAFGKEQTPDLSCGDGGNTVMRDLIRDASQIITLLQATEAGPESGVR
ncbi:MAG: hypothetical protein ABSG41_25920 [Bryobacteraceae bacterium]|jgi:hypothetical protein